MSDLPKIFENVFKGKHLVLFEANFREIEFTIPVDEWGAAEVEFWAKQKHLGKFANIVTKEKLDGLSLIQDFNEETLTDEGFSRLQIGEILGEIELLKRKANQHTNQKQVRIFARLFEVRTNEGFGAFLGTLVR